MPVKVLIAEPLDFSPEAIRLLRQSAEVDLRSCDREGIGRALAEYDVVWFRLAHRFDRAMLENATRCRILATPVTGLDHIDLAACAQRGIEVVSLRGETEFLRTIRATAELTVGILLALLRHIPAAAQAARSGDWDRDRFRGQELYGKTVGIVGVGRLGNLVAGYLRAFGAVVIGYDHHPDFSPELVCPVDSLDALLAQADIVSIHVPYTAATRHLFGHKQFAAMRPGSILVNTSRGGIVDEQALLAALESGRLAGAALDVLDGEPAIGRDHPVLEYARNHENVLVVPHLGGNTRESFAKTECFLAGRVLEALERQAAARDAHGIAGAKG